MNYNRNPAKTIISYKKYNYNAYGEVIRTESYVEGEEFTTGKTIQETVYDDNGNVIKSFTYNSLDTSSKFYTETEYDENSKVLAEVDATGENRTKFGYVDGTSIVKEELLPNGSKFAYGRDYDDMVTAISQSTEDGEENSTQKIYRYGEVIELKSGNNNVKYAYDSKRRLKAVDLNGVENYVQYAYTETLDSNGCITKETVTAMYKSDDVFVSEKDGKGNLLKLTANDVVQIENVYNNKNQLDTLKDKVASKNYKFERDVLDNVTAIYEVNDSGSKVSSGYDEKITYDEFGSLKKRTLSGVVSQVYDYNYSDDSKRQVKSLVTPITSEEYEYDALNRKKKTSQVFAGHNFGKRYNYKKVSDHATNLIQSIAYLKNGSTDGKLSYTYDNMGNITSINENGKQIAKYTYDTLNRIIKENLLDKSKEIVYTYDNNGNILTKSVNGEIVEYKYKEDSDQLVSFGDEAFEYDSIGNPTTYRGMTSTFENGRRLKSLSDGTNTVEYTYNGQGSRASKKVGNVTIEYTYDRNGRLLKEVGEKTIEYVYGADGIIGIKINGTPYLFRKNMFGDVTHIYNQQGVIVGKYSYTAFGECTVELDTNSVASDNPIRYRSYYYDEETSLYYLKTRYYDPEIGRFMTIDGISYLNANAINGLNMYAYCGNNPVMGIDPNGTSVLGVLAGIAAYVFSGVIFQAAVTATSFVGMAIASIWDTDIREDLNKLRVGETGLINIFNDDIDIITSSKKVSFYKGAPIFIGTLSKRSGSFGLIYLNEGRKTGETIQHEYGHNKQIMLLGPLNYLFSIGVPSFLMLGLDKYEVPVGKEALYNYYRQPWEASADMFGDVGFGGRTKADRTPQDEAIAREYLLMAYLMGPLAYLYFDNKYNFIE